MVSSLSSVPPVCPSARPLSMGTRRPAAAAMGAMRKDVLSPTPPVECLSTVGRAGLPSAGRRRSSCTPEVRMAWVSARTSAGSIPRRKVPIRKALSCASSMESLAAPRAMCAISASLRVWPSRLRRMMLLVSSGAFALSGMGEIEAEGEELGERVSVWAPVKGKEDEAVGRHELGEDLAAGAAGGAGRVVEIGDGDGMDAQLWAVLRDGAHDRGALRTDGEAVGGVLDVGRGDDFAAFEQQCRADAKAGVGRIGVLCRIARGGEQLSLLTRGERDGGRRHLASRLLRVRLACNCGCAGTCAAEQQFAFAGVACEPSGALELGAGFVEPAEAEEQLGTHAGEAMVVRERRLGGELFNKREAICRAEGHGDGDGAIELDDRRGLALRERCVERGNALPVGLFAGAC